MLSREAHIITKVMEDTRDTFSVRKKLHLLALYVSLQHEKLIGFLLLSKTGSLRRPSLSLALIAPKIPVPLFKYFFEVLSRRTNIACLRSSKTCTGETSRTTNFLADVNRFAVIPVRMRACVTTP